MEKVLTVDTLEAVNRSPSFNRYGYKILARWAMNSPEKLKALETSSQFQLLVRVLEQQLLEQDILTAPEALEQLRTGLVEHEILALHEVNTEL
jgi:hypothetical protein